MTGWLDQNSLARFVVEVVEQLDIIAVEALYRLLQRLQQQWGKPKTPPAMLLPRRESEPEGYTGVFSALVPVPLKAIDHSSNAISDRLV
jgi:hypothetical protein